MKHAFRRLVLVSLAAGLLAAPPAAAEFGTYTQWACRLPDGSPAPTDGFYRVYAYGTVEHNDDACSGGGTMRPVVQNPQPGWYATGESWTFKPPAELKIAGVTARRSLTGLDGDSRMAYSLAYTTDVCDASHACDSPGDYSWRGELEAVGFGLGCTTLDSCHSTTGTNQATVDIARVAVELVDEHLPRFSSTPAGDLLAPVVRGTQSLSFTAEDNGGGVYGSALIVDGVEQPRRVIDDNGGKCKVPFVHSVPCKPTVAGAMSLDTATLTEGTHEIGVVVFDATGTNNVTFGPVAVEVDNVPDPTSESDAGNGINGNGSTNPPSARLVGLGRFARDTVRQPFSRGTVGRGRLVDTTGSALVGATLKIYETTAGRAERLVGTTTTASNGTFRFVIPKGVSRQITVRYAPTGSVDRVSWNFRLAVPAPLKLIASRHRLRNGQKLILTAYLAGARVPSRSAAVAFQVLIGHQWRTFATRNIDNDGRARVGHRFRVTYERLTYKFRAVIVGRRTFPFTNATSRPDAVQVN